MAAYDAIIILSPLKRAFIRAVNASVTILSYVTRYKQSRKYLMGRSYKNNEFDWPFLFGYCIIARHESITQFWLDDTVNRAFEGMTRPKKASQAVAFIENIKE